MGVILPDEYRSSLPRVPRSSPPHTRVIGASLSCI